MLRSLMTAGESEGRYCPMGVACSSAVPLCAGPECMAWRWFDGAEVVEDERRGYCGMAGVPEVGM